MPFVSRAQQKWAFATKQPFAKDWAAMTDQARLPDRVSGPAQAGLRNLKARHRGGRHGKAHRRGA